MTNKRLTTQNLMDWPFAGNSIGFENLLDSLHQTSRQPGAYPPYNIVRVDDLTQRLEIALAGFTSEDISITQEKNVLTITGAITTEETEDNGGEDYIHKGISGKSFIREFTLGEHVEVDEAKMENGMLTVVCKTVVPEKLQPKTIEIS